MNNLNLNEVLRLRVRAANDCELRGQSGSSAVSLSNILNPRLSPMLNKEAAGVRKSTLSDQIFTICKIHSQNLNFFALLTASE